VSVLRVLKDLLGVIVSIVGILRSVGVALIGLLGWLGNEKLVCIVDFMSFCLE